ALVGDGQPFVSRGKPLRVSVEIARNDVDVAVANPVTLVDGGREPPDEPLGRAARLPRQPPFHAAQYRACSATGQTEGQVLRAQQHVKPGRPFWLAPVPDGFRR